MVIEEADQVPDDEEFTHATIAIDFSFNEEPVYDGEKIIADITINSGQMMLTNGKILPVKFS